MKCSADDSGNQRPQRPTLARSAQPAAAQSSAAAVGVESASWAGPAQSLDSSPRLSAQRAWSAALQASPGQLAQRRQIDDTIGDAAHGASGGEASEKLDGPTTAGPPRDNRTGLPDGLKSGIEALSGIALDHVQVHRGSDRPAALGAHAFAQGTDIHLGPGQEQHLPHEAWHVVQQAQGRVRPTLQSDSGVPINDDRMLEAEADRMGAQALSLSGSLAATAATAPAGAEPGMAGPVRQLSPAAPATAGSVVQRSIGFEYELGNVQTYSKAIDGSKVRLPKPHVLTARPSFDVTADDPPTGALPGAMSDLELITPAINDNLPANRQLVASTLQAMVDYLAVLRQHPIENAVGADFIGAASADRYDDGVLQATAGFSPGGLVNLTSGRTEASAGVARVAAENDQRALAERSWVWDRVGKNAEIDARILGAARQEFIAMGASSPAVFGICQNHLGNIADDTERELMAAVMTRILTIPVAARGGAALPYPKSAAGAVMARSDFATVIGALPPLVMTRFVSDVDFKLRLLHALREASNNDAVDLADPVFPNPIGGAVAMTITLDAWFAGLYPTVGRTDRLTQANYPVGANPAEAPQLESLGSYGNRTDPQAAGATPRPIFEFRNLGSVPVDALVTTGLAVWDLVHRANDGTEA